MLSAEAGWRQKIAWLTTMRYRAREMRRRIRHPVWWRERNVGWHHPTDCPGAPIPRAHIPLRRCWDRCLAPAGIHAWPVRPCQESDPFGKGSAVPGGNECPAIAGLAATRLDTPSLPHSTFPASQGILHSVRGPGPNWERWLRDPVRLEWTGQNRCEPKDRAPPGRVENRAKAHEETRWPYRD